MLFPLIGALAVIAFYAYIGFATLSKIDNGLTVQNFFLFELGALLGCGMTALVVESIEASFHTPDILELFGFFLVLCGGGAGGLSLVWLRTRKSSKESVTSE